MEYSAWLLAVQPFLQQLIAFVAYLVLAIIVFVIGYLISVAIGKLIAEILKSVKFNKIFDKEGWRHALQRANVDVNPSEFVGVIFKWVFVIASLVIAIDVLSNVVSLSSFKQFLNEVLGYLPNVIVAVLVFVAAIIISDIIEKVVRVSIERMKVGYGFLAASIVKWAIWIFTFFLVLDQLLPASILVKTLYTSIVYGIVAALALGVGLAIGLGGKDTAAKIISDLYRKIEEK